MVSQLYSYLSEIGYHHPLHAVLTFMPAGLTIAGFIFLIPAAITKRPSFSQTAMHCTILALLTAIPTILAGYLDWQHFHAGAFILPIKIKLGLAGVLIVLLPLSVGLSWKKEKPTASRFMVHYLSAMMVIGLGYFGGELVYGKKDAATMAAFHSETDTASIADGAALFDRSCSACHYENSTETKVGPGLKGLFQRDRMPVSKWIVSEQSLRRQLTTPFSQMPGFESLTEAEIESLTEYLKTLQ